MKLAIVLVLLALLTQGCSPSSGPQGGSQTNWLVRCESSAECGELECICNVCTTTCSGPADCDDLAGSSCASASDAGAIALCGGVEPPASLCLPRCEESSCASGHSCVAGVCAPDGDATASVSVDPGVRYQTLEGFGASFGAAEDAVPAHPQKNALYDAMFAAGLDALRLGNRYEGSLDVLQSAADIVEGSRQRLGHAPLIFMTSSSPPAALKANAARSCAGNLADCTLASLPAGGFDYAGLASHFRTSLQAYASVGVAPDFLSIQNNPNWIPPAAAGAEACRFLPQEGSADVTIDGASTRVAYAGYIEAVTAVRAAIADLPSAPRLAAPEASGIGSVAEFLSPLQASAFDSVAIHLYGQEADAVDQATLASIRSLAERAGRPVHQTEMQADGRDTALLMQNALAHAGASVYVQNDLATTDGDAADVALFFLSGEGYELRLPYYVLMHFAKWTDPGWIRVGASSDSSDVTVSAFVSPDESALTLVLVNSGPEPHRVSVDFDALRAELAGTEVTRTVFSGVERSAALGELSPADIVEMPASSIVTVALARP